MESFDRQIGRAGAFENVLHLGRDTGEASTRLLPYDMSTPTFTCSRNSSIAASAFFARMGKTIPFGRGRFAGLAELPGAMSPRSETY